MVGFGWSGLCIFRLLFMGLRPLCQLLIAYVSFVLLSIGVVWARRQPLTAVGAVLRLLDGPTVCDPAFCVVWFRFRLHRKYLALWPTEVGRFWRWLVKVALGMDLFTCSLLVLLMLGFGGILSGWVGLGLLLLSNLAGPVQHFKAAILDVWRNKVAADLCVWEGFRSGPLLDVFWLFATSYFQSCSRERQGFVKSVMVGGVWNGCLLGRVSMFHVGSVVLQMVMVTCFGNVPFLLLLRFVKILNFMIS